VPLEALAAANPKAVYILLGTNVLTRDTELTSFLAYYSLMLDEIKELLPDATIYVQSITPVRPEVREDENHDGMYTERFARANNELAALALEKGAISWICGLSSRTRTAICWRNTPNRTATTSRQRDTRCGWTICAPTPCIRPGPSTRRGPAIRWRVESHLKQGCKKESGNLLWGVKLQEKNILC